MELGDDRRQAVLDELDRGREHPQQPRDLVLEPGHGAWHRHGRRHRFGRRRRRLGGGRRRARGRGDERVVELGDPSGEGRAVQSGGVALAIALGAQPVQLLGECRELRRGRDRPDRRRGGRGCDQPGEVWAVTGTAQADEPGGIVGARGEPRTGREDLETSGPAARSMAACSSRPTTLPPSSSTASVSPRTSSSVGPVGVAPRASGRHAAGKAFGPAMSIAPSTIGKTRPAWSAPVRPSGIVRTWQTACSIGSPRSTTRTMELADDGPELSGGLPSRIPMLGQEGPDEPMDCW